MTKRRRLTEDEEHRRLSKGKTYDVFIMRSSSPVIAIAVTCYIHGDTRKQGYHAIAVVVSQEAPAMSHHPGAA